MKRIFTAIITLCMLFSASALAESTRMTVRGTGVVNVTADQAQVVLGVRETSSDVLEAQSVVNEKINAICAALLEAGVANKNIGTESLYIYANYDYSPSNVESLAGYTATNTISITTTEIDRVGEFIDIAFAAGANTLNNVNFTARETADAQEEALQLAVQSAMEKGQIIAEAAGMSIKHVTSIEESTDYYYGDMGAKYSNARGMEEATVSQPTLVQASTVQVTASVIMEFEIE